MEFTFNCFFKLMTPGKFGGDPLAIYDLKPVILVSSLITEFKSSISSIESVLKGCFNFYKYYRIAGELVG